MDNDHKQRVKTRLLNAAMEYIKTLPEDFDGEYFMLVDDRMVAVTGSNSQAYANALMAKSQELKK